MNVTAVLNIEIEPWISCSILRKVNYGVYICSCSVRSEEYMCNTKLAFVYDSHLKSFHEPKCYEGIIQNRLYAPIFVLEDNDRFKKLNLKHSLKKYLVDCALLNTYTK